jgi:hypothetical protein
MKTKSTKPARISRHENQIVTLKKLPKDDALPLQATQICKVLKSKKGKIAVSALLVSLKGVVKTSQPLTAIWAFYRGRLIKEGYIAVSEA